MIESSIDFLGLSILSKQSSEDSLSSDPENLGGHSAFPCTSSLTSTGVVSFTLGLEV